MSEFVVVCVDVRFLLSVRNVLDGGVSLVDGCLDVLQGDLGAAGVEVFYARGCGGVDSEGWCWVLWVLCLLCSELVEVLN